MRYRVELFDDVKSNDLTLYFNTYVDKEQLDQLIYSNINNFSGRIQAFAVDQTTKKKTAYASLNMDLVRKVKSTIKNTASELGLI